MKPERWQQIEQLLDAALDLPPSERGAYIASRTGGDADLRAEVERILAASAEATPLPSSPMSYFAPLVSDLASSEAMPAQRSRIGAYRILRLLGAGGMGAVYLAERADDQYRKHVAVKVLRQGFATAELLQRFRHERQILARLEHPGVARLLDGGVEDGAPYIVMEFVHGVPLDRYCVDHALDVGERLRLFADVCAAVDYAHRNLVVHRDLKPGNILVTADGSVKLLDFGIAKLLDAGETDEPLTRTGMHVMTPEYAAPEQVRGEVITTATDVYALGVILYQLLTGRRPYELAGCSPSEVERMVCETEPIRPSVAVRRVATNRAGDVVATAHRARADIRLRRALRGDLDTIVMKALQKDPARRYAGASELLDDLRRYEQGRPVRARPDTPGYRTRKFVSRHRTPVALAVAVLVLLQFFALREMQLRQRAETSAQRANAVRDYLAGVFEVSDPFGRRPERAEEVTARELLDRGVQRVDEELAGQPDAQAEMLGILGGVYTNLGLFAEAEPLLERALEQRRALYGIRSAEAADALHALAGVALQRGDLERAERLAVEALSVRRSLPGNQQRGIAQSLDRLATIYQERSAYAEAEPLFREALAIRERVLGGEHLEVSESLNNLALLVYWMADYPEAERLYRRAHEIRRRELGDAHAGTAAVAQNLAQVLHLQGEYVEAEQLSRASLAVKRAILGDVHPSVTVHMSNLGALLRDMGRMEEAELHIRDALTLDRRIFGDEHPYVGANLLQLAATQRDAGRFDEAESTFADALLLNRRLLGEEHVRVLQAYEGLGSTRFRRGDVAAAVQSLTLARDLAVRLFGDAHPRAVNAEVSLARALFEQGRHAEAEPMLRGVLAQHGGDEGALRNAAIAARTALGSVLTSDGRAAAALPFLEEAVAMSTEAFGPADWRGAEARMALGRTLTALGRYDAAEPLLVAARDALLASPVRLPRLVEQDIAALEHLYSLWQKPEPVGRLRTAAGS